MKKIFTLTVFMLCVFASSYATDRALEIKDEMWNSGEKAFAAKEAPQKWASKSAVIMAQMHRFEYRKAIIGNQLRKNQYHHYRIKLIDKNAVDKYAEMTFDVSRQYMDVYVGYKVIKPNGQETIVDLARAVKMERTENGRKIAYNKIAIPGLEPGDILDYYICEEASEFVYGYLHFYDPVIHSLPQEYPMMYYKVQFRADRKCYINLKSLNGAPDFKLVTDEKNDEQYYTIEGGELDGADDQRWLFSYRDLPTIKFRAAFAKNESVVAMSDVLLGEKKVAKTKVTVDELEELTASLVKTYAYEYGFLKKYAKTNFKGITDPFELSTKAYYYLRNFMLIKDAETGVWRDESRSASRVTFFSAMHAFLRDKKIAHDIVVTAARNISPIDDVIMENELDWLIRVKKGSDYLYLSPFSTNTVAGTFDALLEGADAYALNGLLGGGSWTGKKFTMPVKDATDHRSDVTLNVTLGENMNNTKVQVKKVLAGRLKLYEQYNLVDYYDYDKEEKKMFKLEEKVYKKDQLALKKAYMDKRITNKQEWLKEYLEENFEFKVKEPTDLVIEQAGRFHDKPEFIYSFGFETEELLKKAGPNYMFDVGRLIEAQLKIEKDEIERNTNIYFDNARSFANKIIIEVPAGYAVEGIEKLNITTENKYGGFTAKARLEGGKIVIETSKHYDLTYVPKADWSSVVSFLNSAYNFNELKLLFKKSN